MEKFLQKSNSVVQFLLFTCVFLFNEIFAFAQVRTENKTCVSCAIFGSIGSIVAGVVVLAVIFTVIVLFVRMIRKNNSPSAPKKF